MPYIRVAVRLGTHDHCLFDDQQAHALTSLLTESDPPKFPFLTLLVSGGHTLLLLAYSPTRFKILATTVDSAIG